MHPSPLTTVLRQCAASAVQVQRERRSRGPVPGRTDQATVGPGYRRLRLQPGAARPPSSRD